MRRWTASSISPAVQYVVLCRKVSCIYMKMAALLGRIITEGLLLSRNCAGGISLARNSYNGVRFLFAPASLGLDAYTRTRERTKMQFVNLIDKFKIKMNEFTDPKSTNMIFTEDLKNIIHLADATEEDMSLVHKMMKKFNEQNKAMRFGSYVFGPVVMRMYYMLDKPDEALQVFTDPDLEDFFAQLSTYQILMDLLYENQRYQDMLDVFQIVKQRQHQDSKFPKNVVILTYAACYKLNTPESFKFGTDLWKELNEVGHLPMRRAMTFAAGLALNQNAPHIALEILSYAVHQSYVTIRNLKVASLAEVGRPEDALPVLRSIIDIDVPVQKKQTFCPDVMARVRRATEKLGNKEVSHEFEQIEKRLADGGHISTVSLDEQLCMQIAETSRTEIQERNQRMLAASFNRQDRGGRAKAFARPGLNDLV